MILIPIDIIFLMCYICWNTKWAIFHSLENKQCQNSTSKWAYYNVPIRLSAHCVWAKCIHWAPFAQKCVFLASRQVCIGIPFSQLYSKVQHTVLSFTEGHRKKKLYRAAFFFTAEPYGWHLPQHAFTVVFVYIWVFRQMWWAYTSEGKLRCCVCWA